MRNFEGGERRRGSPSGRAAFHEPELRRSEAPYWGFAPAPTWPGTGVLPHAPARHTSRSGRSRVRGCRSAEMPARSPASTRPGRLLGESQRGRLSRRYGTAARPSLGRAPPLEWVEGRQSALWRCEQPRPARPDGLSPAAPGRGWSRRGGQPRPPDGPHASGARLSTAPAPPQGSGSRPRDRACANPRQGPTVRGACYYALIRVSGGSHADSTTTPAPPTAAPGWQARGCRASEDRAHPGRP